MTLLRPTKRLQLQLRNSFKKEFSTQKCFFSPWSVSQVLARSVLQLSLVRKLSAAVAYLVSTNCPTENDLQPYCGAEFKEPCHSQCSTCASLPQVEIKHISKICYSKACLQHQNFLDLWNNFFSKRLLKVTLSKASTQVQLVRIAQGSVHLSLNIPDDRDAAASPGFCSSMRQPSWRRLFPFFLEICLEFSMLL